MNKDIYTKNKSYADEKKILFCITAECHSEQIRKKLNNNKIFIFYLIKLINIELYALQFALLEAEIFVYYCVNELRIK